MDGPLTLFTTVCLLASLLAVRGPQVRLAWWLVAAVACSLGILTKGPVALVLTLPPLVSLLWLDHRPARVRVWHWLAAVAVILLVTAPWFVLIAQRQGDFASQFLWKHHILRFASAFDHQAPFWYFVPVLFLGMFPSSLLFGPTLGFLFGRRDDLRMLRTAELGAVALAAVWILAFFSASSCKLPTYILPAVPLLCLTQGSMLHHLLSGAFANGVWARLAHRLPVHAIDMAVAAGASHRGRGPAVGTRPGCGTGDQLRRDRRVPGVLGVPGHPLADVASADGKLGAGGRHFAADHGIRFPEVRARFRDLPLDQCQRSAQFATRRMAITCRWSISSGNVTAVPSTCRPIRSVVSVSTDLAGMQRFVDTHPQAVVIADRQQVDRLQETLGSRATFTRSRGGRGRVYLLSTLPAPRAVIGTRDDTAVQR